MHKLQQALQDHDRGQLGIVAELWGLPLEAAPAARAAQALSQAMLKPGAVEEMLEGLSPAARQALRILQQHGGHMPWVELGRRFGPLREMGPARRDRDKPWRHPASALEELWYCAFIGRAFTDTPKGLEEFGYIPHDLLQRLPPPESPAPAQSDPPELVPVHIQSADTLAVDDATTLLAASRLPARAVFSGHLLRPESLPLLSAVLQELGCLQPPSLEADPDRSRSFLEAPRGEGMRQLLRAWVEAPTWNDLAQLDGLAPPKSGWPNHPPSSRQAALELILSLPADRWWSLDGFRQSVRKGKPGFLRAGGEFDSWYLQDSRTGEFLHGIEAWDRIEGALLEYVLTGPLHWLGAVDLGGEPGSSRPTSFRLTELALLAVKPQHPFQLDEPTRRAQVAADGQVTVPRYAARPLRYQIARFCRWLPLDRRRGIYRYQLTPSSMQAGREAGLLPRHMLAVLQEVSHSKLPPPVGKAIRRWEERGAEAEISRKLVLRVSAPQVLQELRAHPSTARYVKEVLDASQALVAEADWQALCRAAIRRGILIDWPAE